MSKIYPKLQTGGTLSQLGYKRHSPYNKASSLLIHTPTGSITMKEVDHPILGIGHNEIKFMLPNKEYQFKSSKVLEIPMKSIYPKKYQQGGQAPEMSPEQQQEIVRRVRNLRKTIGYNKVGSVPLDGIQFRHYMYVNKKKLQKEDEELLGAFDENQMVKLMNEVPDENEIPMGQSGMRMPNRNTGFYMETPVVTKGRYLGNVSTYGNPSDMTGEFSTYKPLNKRSGVYGNAKVNYNPYQGVTKSAGVGANYNLPVNKSNVSFSGGVDWNSNTGTGFYAGVNAPIINNNKNTLSTSYNVYKNPSQGEKYMGFGDLRYTRTFKKGGKVGSRMYPKCKCGCGGISVKGGVKFQQGGQTPKLKGDAKVAQYQAMMNRMLPENAQIAVDGVWGKNTDAAFKLLKNELREDYAVSKYGENTSKKEVVRETPSVKKPFVNNQLDKTYQSKELPEVVINAEREIYKPVPTEDSVDEPTWTEKLSGLYNGFQRAVGKYTETKAPTISYNTKPKLKTNVAKNTTQLPKDNIGYGYERIGTAPDESGSLHAFRNTFDNESGGKYHILPKMKELQGRDTTLKNVEGVAHFIMDGDVTENQKFTKPYVDARGNTVRSAYKNKFIHSTPQSPDSYLAQYKKNGDGLQSVRYRKVKDIKGIDFKKGDVVDDEGYNSNLGVRSHKFSDIDWEGKGKTTSYKTDSEFLNTFTGKPTSIVNRPGGQYSRFSGGSGIYVFTTKEGKKVGIDVAGSVTELKKEGEEIIKKYKINPNELDFLYHDMGSYSAKPQSNSKGELSSNQWSNYNKYNRGYSGAALVIPKHRYTPPNNILKKGEDSFNIKDIRGDSLMEGSKDTPKKIEYIGVHHTGTDNLKQALDHSKSSNEGYHFLIDKDGTIVNVMDTRMRTNHWGGDKNPNNVHKTAKNSNSIGISYVSKKGEITKEQELSGSKLLQKLSKENSIKLENILGHGDVSKKGHRIDTEGYPLINAYRKQVKFQQGGTMDVLDEDGNSQMKIVGGERIFSRVATSKMLMLNEGGKMFELGKFVCDELSAQEKRKPQYVKE